MCQEKKGTYCLGQCHWHSLFPSLLSLHVLVSSLVTLVFLLPARVVSKLSTSRVCRFRSVVLLFCLQVISPGEKAIIS